jgi:hypothetical protein
MRKKEREPDFGRAAGLAIYSQRSKPPDRHPGPAYFWLWGLRGIGVWAGHRKRRRLTSEGRMEGKASSTDPAGQEDAANLPPPRPAPPRGLARFCPGAWRPHSLAPTVGCVWETAVSLPFSRQYPHSPVPSSGPRTQRPSRCSPEPLLSRAGLFRVSFLHEQPARQRVPAP